MMSKLNTLDFCSSNTSEYSLIILNSLSIISYAESLYYAAALNEDVKQAMDDIIALDTVSSAELNSDYNFTDTETKKYRYQAVYDLVY